MPVGDTEHVPSWVLRFKELSQGGLSWTAAGLTATGKGDEKQTPVSHVPEKSHPVRLLAQPLQKSTGKRNVSSFEFPPSDIAVSDW